MYYDEKNKLEMYGGTNMAADLLLTHFNQVFCPKDLGHPLFGEGDEGSSGLEDGYIAAQRRQNSAVGKEPWMPVWLDQILRLVL